MKNFVQPGDVLTFTAPVGDVVSGTGYQIGSLFCVAAADAAAGAEFEGQITGVFDLPKATGAGWTEGQVLYWDDSAKKVTGTVGANLLIGTAARVEASGDTIGRVRLNGTAGDTGAGNVGTAELAAGAVTAAKAAVFFSAETVATGAAQNVAHGLGVAPAGVLIVPTEHPGVPDTGAFDIAEGTHTTTNVVFTATVNLKVKVFAWA